MQIKPISNTAFAVKMAKMADFQALAKKDKAGTFLFAVGVSGGADSMALCRLLHEYAKSIGGAVLALTVEHGLRAESADEAEQVHKWLTSMGIAHRTLVWQGKKPVTRIEETARFARYDLLINECKKEGIRYLCLAHNKRDNAETFFIRLAKSSGVDGLSAMRAMSNRGGVVLLRPLLDFSRDEIEATNNAFSQGWIEDPSNQNERYERVKWRNAMPYLASLGLTGDVIVKAAAKQAAVSEFLKSLESEFYSAYTQLNPFGFVSVDRQAFVKLHKELAVRILKRLLMTVGATSASDYPPKSESIADLYTKIITDNLGGGATLFNTKVMKKEKGNRLYIVKELRACMPDTKIKKGQQSIVWDRFVVSFSRKVDADGLVVGAMGNLRLPDGVKDKAKTLPAAVLTTCPVIKDKDGLLLIPLLGYNRDMPTCCDCGGCDCGCGCVFSPFVKDILKV